MLAIQQRPDHEAANGAAFENEGNGMKPYILPKPKKREWPLWLALIALFTVLWLAGLNAPVWT